MLLPEFAYARSTSVDGALELLASNDNARALAGGQTLINAMKTRFVAPELLVDVSPIDELRVVAERDDGTLVLGPLTTYRDLSNGHLAGRCPILARVAGRIADAQVRSRGTLGGNLCANDPTNDLPPLMVALDATMSVASPAGVRDVSADDFFLGVFATAVSPNELLTAVALSSTSRSSNGYQSVGVGREGTGVVNVAAHVELQEGTIGSARVVIGCVAAVPVRATEFEQRLAGSAATEAAIREAAAGIGDVLNPPSDVHAPAKYRRKVAEILAARAVLEACEDAKGR